MLRQVADPFARLKGVAENIESLDFDCPARCRHEAGNNPHGGGLARAVGTEEAEDLTRIDLEGNIRDRGQVTVAFRQVLHVYHGVGDSRMEYLEGLHSLNGKRVIGYQEDNPFPFCRVTGKGNRDVPSRRSVITIAFVGRKVVRPRRLVKTPGAEARSVGNEQPEQRPTARPAKPAEQGRAPVGW